MTGEATTTRYNIDDLRVGNTQKPRMTGAPEPDPEAFWNINVAPSQRTVECPSYLRYALANDKDRNILSTPDSKYHVQTWEEVNKQIRSNRLDLFQRMPSELRKYREYMVQLVEKHGTVMDFVMSERLKWPSLLPRGRPFEFPEQDVKIVYNDWPYGVDPRIVHLVLWTKFHLADDPGTDDLVPEARRHVEEYVEQMFVAECGRENVVWFRNWPSLKTIDAVEHVHVMLYDPPKRFVEKITGGDVPLTEKVARAQKEGKHERGLG